MQMPGRSFSSTSYRYGFNGKEKSDEINGSGVDYVYGERIYNSRIVLWLSIDRKTSKFPFESPYTYVSNNPLIHIDPDGEEKVVVTGGADLHNKNRLNFAMASQTQLKNYLNERKKTNDKFKQNEQVTWLMLDKDYSPKEKKGFEQWSKNKGVTLVYVKSADQVTNYLNSKSVNKPDVGAERCSDGITTLSFFSHGTPSAIALGYANTGYSYHY